MLRALGSGGTETAELALVRHDSEPGTALARPSTGDTELVLARLATGPRTVGSEIEMRLGYVRAMRGAVWSGLGVMFGGIALSIATLAAKLPALGMLLMFASVGAFFLTPLAKRKQARALYANGSVTRGRILQARSEQGPLYVTYVFRHGERDYKGYLLTNDAFIANRVGPDTPVFVFFDPQDPRRNAGLLHDELPKALRGEVGEE